MANAEKEFGVVDRRVSTEMAQENHKAEHKTEHKPEQKPKEAPQAQSKSANRAAAAEEMPPIDFTTFVLSLSTSCLFHLGEVAESPGAPPTANLPIAKQTIDLLALLEDKTRGNLTGEEERLLTQILYDLRMRYVSKSRP